MKRLQVLSTFVVLSFLLAACAQALPSTEVMEEEVQPEVSIDEPVDDLSLEDIDNRPPPNAEKQFTTDFSRKSIAFTEILSGGPPKDGIPAVDFPSYVSIEDADAWLAETEPVIAVELGGAARAYPVQILMWHEIANDELNGIPISVTYCPLCNTAITFKREVEGKLLDFGTTGYLRLSNLVMYDRQTETWWQQATGEAIVGELLGTILEVVPAPLISWGAFKAAYPDGDVLSRDTGFSRTYGSNPYYQYDDENSQPFLFYGPQTPEDLPSMARVITIDLPGEAVAYPYTLLEQEIVINDVVGELHVAVFWQPGTASALDSGSIAEGKDVGSATTYERTVDGQELTFDYDGTDFIDQETGSKWNALGLAVEGELAGTQLKAVASINHFWFSWAAFRPETRIYGIDESEDKGGAINAPPQGREILLVNDFQIDLYQTANLGLEGNIAFSEVFKFGKPVVLNLFAGLCPVCRTELPMLQTAFESYGDSVIFLGLDIGSLVGLGDRSDGMELLTALGITYAVGENQDSAILMDYGVFGTPGNLFFKADGTLQRVWNGKLLEAQLDNFIQEILG